jgi:hypothetical protein
MKFWRSTNNRLSDMAGRQEFAILLDLNRLWPRHKRPLPGNSCTPSIPAMAAAYLFHLCQNHAFIDGNKRVGANSAITFLLMNNWDTTFGEEELVDVVLSVASGRLGKEALPTSLNPGVGLWKNAESYQRG